MRGVSSRHSRWSSWSSGAARAEAGLGQPHPLECADHERGRNTAGRPRGATTSTWEHHRRPLPSASYFSRRLPHPGAEHRRCPVSPGSRAPRRGRPCISVAVTAVDLGGLEDASAPRPSAGLRPGKGHHRQSVDRRRFLRHRAGRDCGRPILHRAERDRRQPDGIGERRGAVQHRVGQLGLAGVGWQPDRRRAPALGHHPDVSASNVNVGANGDTISPDGDRHDDVHAARPPPHAEAVTRTGSGSVSSVPAGIQCGSTCAETVTAGTSVALTAAAGQRLDVFRVERRQLWPKPGPAR